MVTKRRDSNRLRCARALAFALSFVLQLACTTGGDGFSGASYRAVECAPNDAALGVDVSRHQLDAAGRIDWTALVEDGADFAVVKLGGGELGGWDEVRGTYVSAAQVQPALEAGLAVGGYWFLGSGGAFGDDGAAQAAAFLETAQLQFGDAPILALAVDVEPDGSGLRSGSAARMLADFVSEFEARTDFPLTIYANRSNAQDVGWVPAEFRDHPLWLPAWNTTCATMPTGWTGPLAFQQVSSGSPLGRLANVDIDLAHVPVAELGGPLNLYRGCSTSMTLTPARTQFAAAESFTARWCLQAAPRCRLVAIDAETRQELAPTPNAAAPCAGEQLISVPAEWTGRTVQLCATDDATQTTCSPTVFLPTAEIACDPDVSVGGIASCSYALWGTPPLQRFRAPLLVNGVESGLAVGGLMAGDGFFQAPAAPDGVDEFDICVTSYAGDAVQVSACTKVRVLPTNCSPSSELCDGLDNDCDGVIDEDPSGVGAACDGADGDACAEGVVVCEQGALVCGDTTGDDVEICGDGVDNDCRGGDAICPTGGGDELRIALDSAWANWCPAGPRVIAWDSDGGPHQSAAGQPFTATLDASWRGGHVMVGVTCVTNGLVVYADLLPNVGESGTGAGFAVQLRGRDVSDVVAICLDPFTGRGAKLVVALELQLEGTCP